MRVEAITATTTMKKKRNSSSTMTKKNTPQEDYRQVHWLIFLQKHSRKRIQKMYTQSKLIPKRTWLQQFKWKSSGQLKLILPLFSKTTIPWTTIPWKKAKLCLLPTPSRKTVVWPRTHQKRMILKIKKSKIRPKSEIELRPEPMKKTMIKYQKTCCKLSLRTKRTWARDI